MLAKKVNVQKSKKQNVFLSQSKEVASSGRLYCMLDGTICSSREQAISGNHEIHKDYLGVN